MLTLGSFHQVVSVYAPLHGMSNPKYGLGGYEPLLFYLCVLVSLIFATRLPNYLEDTDESVVVTFRPPSNFLLSLSRVLTPTLSSCPFSCPHFPRLSRNCVLYPVRIHGTD